MANYGIKELYSVALKATYNMEFAGRNYAPGEVVLSFDKLQIAYLNEKKNSVFAHGGYSDKTLLTWDNTKEVSFTATEGVLSLKSLGIVSNSQVSEIKENIISVPIIGEILEPENGIITLKHQPNGKGFIYNKETEQKLFSDLTESEYPCEVTAIADYYYNYTNGGQLIEIGKQQFSGYLMLEGKMRLKDDFDGHDKTAIITIPRIRIASSLAMRLGKNANPTVGNFSFIGYPVGENKAQKVVDIQILNDDIDSDF